MKKVHFVSVMLLYSTSAHAAGDAGCWSVQDKEARLSCYDKAHADPLPEPSSAVKAITPPAADQEEKTATTSDLIKAKPSDPPKRIDADDLAIAPNKYIGKNVELNKMQCFYADKDEYRCVAGGASATILLIQAPDITPAVEKQKLENECGEIKKMATTLCRRTLRFSPVGVDNDTVGLRSRTVVTAQSFEVVPSSPPTRRR